MHVTQSGTPPWNLGGKEKLEERKPQVCGKDSLAMA